MKRARAIYRTLLYAYPAPFRHEYGRQMCLMFEEQLGEARRRGAWPHEVMLWARAAWDLVTIAPREHGHLIRQDVHHAIRTMVAKPAFTIVAVLSLTLGIGANIAIFSLWNAVLHAPLPGVDSPEDLVMMTDPGASGMVRGRSLGPRRWLTYREFEDLRNHAQGFSDLMASQSSLNAWDVRVDGGSVVEEMRGRLVSSSFFDVLGTGSAMGRLFSTTEDTGEHAVISYSLWQRRFGGQADVIGTTLTIRDTPLTIIGVTPAGFVGETNGQQPDLWLPLRLQPRVLPGSDWLHERPPDKLMWLHVFGRLKPGVTNDRAEAQANAIFRTNLESFYGARSELLDQRLLLQPGTRGASASRDAFSSSLSMLLASVGVLLLITSANLTNLLLARGAARQTEMAIRLSIGASRARLIRQLATESLVLAAIGGLTGLAAAYVMHGALVRMLQQAEPNFHVGFVLTVPLVAFAATATLVTALVFGALPAWQFTKTDPGSRLKDSSRGAIGSTRELRSGRWLVAAQMALSLPLLVGAGLMARTVYNLQHPDLGFQVERLLLARIDISPIVHDTARRDRVLRELQDRLRIIPGVDAASFSQVGLFSGGISTAAIEVGGSTAADPPERDSALDRVGAGYFTTLRVPLLRGRDIAEGDRAATQKVCIVNEAFVRQYFGGQDPIGMGVTTVDDDVRAMYEVVGVVRNARTQHLRGEVEPRFFVPAEQRRSQGTNRTFVIRTESPARVMTAVRDAMSNVDPALSASDIDLIPLEDYMAPLTADERLTARLAGVFATVALMLAAIGLYGVLSYGITRRSGEIAIRLALGAEARGIIAMILAETTGLVVAGLLAGAVLAYAASRMIAGRLYGVTPHDPLTVVLATVILMLVALIAAYLPARRAARVNPMAALQR